MSYLMTPVKKARLTLDYLASNGGAMPEEVVDRFLVVTIESSDFLSSCTTRKMNSTTYRVPTWEFGSRALHARTRGQALTDGQRTTPTTAGPTITAYDYAAEITLEREDLESGVEGNGMINLIMKALQTRVKTDAAEIVLKSSTVSGDADLANFNGYYTSVVTNTAAAGTTRLSPVNMTSIFKTMPSQFQNAGLTFRTGINAVIDYQNSVEDRPTNLGDQVLQGKWMSHWHGTKVVGDQLLPQNLGAGSNTIGVLSDEKNCNIGFHRQITSDNDKDVRAGTIFVVFTVRMGMVWSVEKAAAQLTGILAS
jgi:hypothetical protein